MRRHSATKLDNIGSNAHVRIPKIRTPYHKKRYYVLILFFLAIYVIIYRKNHATEELVHTKCLPTAVWSQSIARTCCDVYPYSVEGGNVIDNGGAYTTSGDIHKGSSVYVEEKNLVDFVKNIFSELPKSISIVLISDQSTSRQTLEVFGRDKGSVLLDEDDWSIALEDFLSDKRLDHWFVQNLDLVKCPKSKPDCGKYDSIPNYLAQKVTLIPVGVDLSDKLHTNDFSSCDLQRTLEYMNSKFPNWADRPENILTVFSELTTDDQKNAHEAIAAMQRECNSCINQIRSTTKEKLWASHGSSAYVLSPQGRSIDTHGVWEALFLGSVPVVISSRMDSLYEEFPIIILKSWNEISTFKTWKADIVRRHGSNPFSFRMRQKLTTGYWVGRIEAMQRGITQSQ
eukprot:CFRG5086T1